MLMTINNIVQNLNICRVEREAFEQRLKERDDAKTRKMAEAKLSKEDLADIERRKYANEEERQELLPRLRSVLQLNQPVMLHQAHSSSHHLP